MDNLKFDYHSLRAQEARIAVKLSKTWRILLQVFNYLALITGFLLLIIKISIGWLLIALALIGIMIYQWWKWHLHRLAPINKSTIDSQMSVNVLGRLPDNPSPKDLANILIHTSSGVFLAARFGLGAKFFQELASDDRQKMPIIWQNAVELRKHTNSPTISGGLLALAIVQAFPNYENLLNRLQLDLADLIDGVKWHDYIHARKDYQNTARLNGGIARDWAFGYTPLLDRFGQNISNQLLNHKVIAAHTAGYDQALNRMIEVFSGNGRQNIALIGPHGVGKTNLIYSLADKLLDADSDIANNLKFRQVYLLDSASLLSASRDKGEIESLVMNLMAESYRAKNIILCFDNAQAVFAEGTGAVDLSHVLLPILEAGNVRTIFVFDDQQYLQLAQINAQLANSFNKINVDQPDEAATKDILKDKIVPLEYRNKVVFMYQAMDEAYRLGERYLYNLAMPAKAIKLLETAVNFNDNGLVTANSIRQAVESITKVKINEVSSTEERDKLLNLEQLIHNQVIGQESAVAAVSNALRRARAGVRNQERPIGTFLFLGPTGVGKTELAKALAKTYFNGPENIIRLDLNEYVTANDVARLIADGATNPNSLTAQVINQPFSVILLDEIEKAHPLVLTSLLQVLDEGVLRDVNGQAVNFKDTIIVATSNAGADRIREYLERGHDIDKFSDQLIDELIKTNQFKPEFLNRFDEVVIFRPLTKPQLLQVLDLILASVNQTLSSKKIKVVVEPEAKNYMVEVGNDPKLGARPMRRMVQKTVENIVAKKMLELGNQISGQEIKIDLEQIKSIIKD